MEVTSFKHTEIKKNGQAPLLLVNSAYVLYFQLPIITYENQNLR